MIQGLGCLYRMTWLELHWMSWANMTWYFHGNEVKIIKNTWYYLWQRVISLNHSYFVWTTVASSFSMYGWSHHQEHIVIPNNLRSSIVLYLSRYTVAQETSSDFCLIVTLENSSEIPSQSTWTCASRISTLIARLVSKGDWPLLRRIETRKTIMTSSCDTDVFWSSKLSE